jgi:hypothetical protein
MDRKGDPKATSESSVSIGFIYIWYDRKHKRFYVGSHWGSEDDGYICSSTWMKQAYKKRPEDFKRRILERYDDRASGNDLEHRWLQMIKPEELKGKRYYNLRNTRFGHWSLEKDSRLTVGQKITQARLNMSEEKRSSYRGRNMKQYVTDSMREKCRIARSKQIITEEHKKKISAGNKGKVRTSEMRARTSALSKGRRHSEETKMKMRQSHLARRNAGVS